MMLRGWLAVDGANNVILFLRMTNWARSWTNEYLMRYVMNFISCDFMHQRLMHRIYANAEDPRRNGHDKLLHQLPRTNQHFIDYLHGTNVCAHRKMKSEFTIDHKIRKLRL